MELIYLFIQVLQIKRLTCQGLKKNEEEEEEAAVPSGTSFSCVRLWCAADVWLLFLLIYQFCLLMCDSFFVCLFSAEMSPNGNLEL